jgi:F-type H+-transporting ATPase subunit k
MVQYYQIAGAKVGSHYLAMGVLAALFGGSYAALSGPSKKTVQTPPINASSPEEGDFIKKFLDEQEQEAKKAKH